MSELSTLHNVPEYSVSELSVSIKKTVESKFGFIKVRGEISGLKRPGSGHVYLSLKDDQSVLAAVCWRGNADRFANALEEGMEVVCTGKITTYAGQSKYQLVIDYMEPAGIGALMALLEKRKAMYIKEGLFDPSRKQQLPYFPKTIGIVTSPTGAVIKDMLHRIEDRFPCHIILWPVQVQGELASTQIASAIQGFNAMDNPPDVLIVARGGGSIEDLWAFNEDEVVRAVSASHIPVISAVGHETDTTLIDYVADVRAPTPTAAAEFAVPVKDDLRYTVQDLARRQHVAVKNILESKHNMLTHMRRALRSPAQIYSEKVQYLDHLDVRLKQTVQQWFVSKSERIMHLKARLQSPQQQYESAKQRFSMIQNQCLRLVKERHKTCQDQLSWIEKLFDAYDYKNVLKRGYALVYNEQGDVLTSTQHTSPGMRLKVELSDGTIKASVQDG